MSAHTDILSDRMRAAANASSFSVTQDFNHLLKRRGIINFQSTANRKNILVKPKRLTPLGNHAETYFCCIFVLVILNGVACIRLTSKPAVEFQ